MFRNKKLIYVLLIITCVLLSMVSLFFSFTKQNQSKSIQTYVNGHSMEPTIYNGAKICLFEKYYRSSADVKSEDIIGIHFNGRDINMVKRVIGTPSDQIIFGKDGYIYKNNLKLEEPYIPGQKFTTNSNLKLLLTQIERFGGRIPTGMFLILGDNRTKSLDSTQYGLIHFDQILGKVEVMSGGNCR